MSSRFTISGLEHFIRMLSKHPTFMALPSLAPLQYVAKEAQKAAESCGCNAAEVYQKHKRTFELALNNMQNGDHLVIKQVLGVQQLCYYVRNATGSFVLKCI